MLIAVGSDHAGLEMKLELTSLLRELGHECMDFGTDTPQSVDYPDFGEKVAETVTQGKAERGILIARLLDGSQAMGSDSVKILRCP